MSAISAKGLTKARSQGLVLDGVDLEVPEGSLLAVLGASGSGKTTLLRLLAGFDRVDAGRIAIAGHVVDGPGSFVPPEERGVGYVPQDAALFPHLTVARNVGFGIAGRGPARERRVEELLETVGLAGYGRRYPHQLSGGQAQRVAIARALATGPSVVLLDEPFAALDLALRGALRTEVLGLLRSAEVTTVLVTHDQDEALSEADAVAVLEAGRVAQHGAPEEVYTQPVGPSVASFVGSANLVPGVADGHEVTTALGAFPTVAEAQPGEVQVVVRPEQLLVVPAGEGVVAARVVRRWYYGHDSVLELEVAGLELPLISRLDTLRRFQAGEEVWLRVQGPVAVFAR